MKNTLLFASGIFIATTMGHAAPLFSEHDKQVDALLAQMALDEKIGQMVQVDASDLKNADAVIVVVGEQPYAEMKGDRDELNLSAEDVALIAKAKAGGGSVLTILFSGRPLVLNSALTNSDAFVAAWLPGTEGLGLTDVLFGDHQFTGKLPPHWPASNDKSARPQFPFGFGLAK